jgi:hypothetical protein
MPLQTHDGKTPEGISTRKTWAISYDLLIPNPNNPRDLSLPEEQAALDELVADLAPGFDADRPMLVKEVTVGEQAGKFMTWDGNRRYAALGIVLARDPEYSRMIPSVKTAAGTDDIDLEYISLRSPSRPLAPLAEANQIFRLLKKGQSEDEIARRMHKGVDYVRGRLELREAPDAIKAAVNNHEIAPTEARKLAKTPDPTTSLAVARKAADGGKIRTRHVAAAVEATAPTPRQKPLPMGAEQKSLASILATLTSFHALAAVRKHVTAEVEAAMDRLRGLVR